MDSKRILLVEDDNVAQFGSKLLLESLSCVVDVAETGARAIKLAQSKTYDLIFMDIGLPDMKGFVVAEKIRSLTVEGENQVPIVALTANEDERIKKRCLQVGINDFIVKPLTLEESQKMLYRCLK